MIEFLPNGSIYAFLGVASVLFALMLMCFGFYKGRRIYMKKKVGNEKDTETSKRKSKKSNFLNKRGERADKDDEIGGADNQADKSKAEIDAKYNNNVDWSTFNVNSQQNSSTSYA